MSEGRHFDEVAVKGAALPYVGQGLAGQFVDPVLSRDGTGPVKPLGHGDAGPVRSVIRADKNTSPRLLKTRTS